MSEQLKKATDLSDAELEQEMNAAHAAIGRAKKRIAELFPERERRKLTKQVRVVCPSCHGRGKVLSRDWASGWEYDQTCTSCAGSGWIMADPA